MTTTHSSAPSPDSSLEFNFDDLIGPTHNYAGLAHGNLASQQNKNLTSNPKAAALQGLEKMKFLADLGGEGIPQAILPPQERPNIQALRNLGFTGNESEILAAAAKDAPNLLASCSSASSMWAANAATVSPSPDTDDHRCHITPANLQSHLHRSLETPFTTKILRTILPGPLFTHHNPLPNVPELSDEGAANHSRLCQSHSSPGIELFVYGDDPSQLEIKNQKSKINPRQSLLASRYLAVSHHLNLAHTLFLQQSPEAINAGVFHNDVIALAHQHLFLYHESAYTNFDEKHLDNLRRAFAARCPGPNNLLPICIPNSVIPLQDAVRSYLFNSQLVTLPDKAKSFLLLAPIECQEIPTAQAAINFIRQQAPIISKVHYIDVRQSMQNGGGPACLRLRIVLTPQQQSALHPQVILTPALYQNLRNWIETNYRDTLTPTDLADPHLLQESRTALDQLTKLLHLPPLYDFQQ